jgi:hypothetical protein
MALWLECEKLSHVFQGPDSYSSSALGLAICLLLVRPWIDLAAMTGQVNSHAKSMDKTKR